VNVTEDELNRLKALVAERDGASPVRRYEVAQELVKAAPDLLATVERLREAIWPGLPKWVPTEREPQQDFHEALIEALRQQSAEVDQYVAVIQGGKRLPAPELNQDPAFAAFVLGGLEKDRAKLLAERAELLTALKKGLYLGEIAVRLGLRNFSEEDENDIIRNHVDLKPMRELYERLTAAPVGAKGGERT
jgi:hypothetical protein